MSVPCTGALSHVPVTLSPATFKSAVKVRTPEGVSQVKIQAPAASAARAGVAVRSAQTTAAAIDRRTSITRLLQNPGEPPTIRQPPLSGQIASSRRVSMRRCPPAPPSFRDAS